LGFWLRFAVETLTTRRLSKLVAVRIGAERHHITVDGLEHLPKCENFVLAVNHYNGRATLDAAAAVLWAVCQVRADAIEQMLFVVGSRQRPQGTPWLVTHIYARWSQHMVRVQLCNAQPSVSGLREWRERDQPVFVFPEGRARLCLGRMRQGSGRWLSRLGRFVIPVGVWWTRETGWQVAFGKPIVWSERVELRDVQLGLAMASLLPAELASDWQVDLQRWREAHTKAKERAAAQKGSVTR
jgi:1-acyl-sn-glycerol-3-phosphate acyltransferase